MKYLKIKKIYSLLARIFFNKAKYAKLLGVNIGRNCKLSNSVDFGSEPYLINIGDNFYCSNNITFITHDGSINVLRNLYPELRNKDYFSPISIGNNVFIGFNVVLLPGTCIGDNVVVGAGSILKGDIKSNSVYAGIPAKYICSIEDYREKKLDFLHETKHLTAKHKKIYLQKNNIFSTNK